MHESLLSGPDTSPILGAGLAAQQPPSDASRAHIITGELTHAIDAKKAKVGDKVTLRLVDHIYSNGKIIVPYRNGKMIGHITHVRPPTKENPQLMVAIEFDRIEVKGGTAFPITAVIQSMTPPDHHMLTILAEYRPRATMPRRRLPDQWWNSTAEPCCLIPSRLHSRDHEQRPVMKSCQSVTICTLNQTPRHTPR